MPVSGKLYFSGGSVSFSRYINFSDKGDELRRGKAKSAFLLVSFALQAALFVI